MVTDPARLRRTDPASDVCPVGDLHKTSANKQTLEKVYCRMPLRRIGCIECKGWQRIIYQDDCAHAGTAAENMKRIPRWHCRS